ncbi:hypothetical protein LJC74_01015 [Eubacteriales bacterium OttesenSCG-928-A19]|nr:hypothetical protein [Eubacteriales bacterium OttesenSCG-928-A19]
MSETVKGRDISAPMQDITINGRRYQMVFNNYAIRLMEDVYDQHFDKDYGFTEILEDLKRFKYRAMQAFYYAGLCAGLQPGDAPLSWEEFDAGFKLGNIDGVQQMLVGMLGDAMPKPDPEQEGQTQDPQ